MYLLYVHHRGVNAEALASWQYEPPAAQATARLHLAFLDGRAETVIGEDALALRWQLEALGVDAAAEHAADLDRHVRLATAPADAGPLARRLAAGGAR